MNPAIAPCVAGFACEGPPRSVDERQGVFRRAVMASLVTPAAALGRAHLSTWSMLPKHSLSSSRRKPGESRDQLTPDPAPREWIPAFRRNDDEGCRGICGRERQTLAL